MKVNGLPGGRRGRAPLSVRKTPDVQKVARALSAPGIDPRLWFSAGTVGTFNDRGQFVTAGAIGRSAVASEKDGLVVDVRLEPSGEFVTARYHGISAGRWCSILAPIAPGDEVLVAIPDGDLNSPAMSIVAVASNRTAPIPTDWANDRLLLDGVAVPIEIRGPAISISSPNLTLNGRKVGRGSEPI